MELQEFCTRCEEQGLKLSDHQIKQFEQYATLLVEWNKKMNLTAITQWEEIIDKHFYDSLLPSFVEKMDKTLCDVGTGAGFPAIPLKIAYPQVRVTLVEPTGKRVLFLREVIEQLQLNEITCYNERAEEFVKEHREQFDIVTARAVANLPILSELCIPLVKVGGLFLAMKGQNGLEEKEMATKAISTLGCTIENIQERTLSDGSKRINLFYRKTKNTPSIYPRAYQKIKAKPL